MKFINNRIVFINKSIAFYDDLILLYKENCPTPFKHYKVNSRSKKILLDIFYGNNVAASQIKNEFLLPFIDSYILPDNLIKKKNIFLISDHSIGGPSNWGKIAANLTFKKNNDVVFISFSRKELWFNGEFLKIPEIWTKVSYIHFVRAFIKAIEPKKILIIGWELAAKLFDIIIDRKVYIMETGFGEKSIVNIEQNNSLIYSQILEELLFRQSVFPWESFSFLIGIQRALEHSYQNIIWSKSKADFIAKKLNLKNVLFNPPSIEIMKNSGAEFTVNKELKILASTGTHIIGENSIKFLALIPLIELANKNSRIKLTILTQYPDNLRKIMKIENNIELLSNIEYSKIHDLYNKFQAFYRVQNDDSLPISCIEAMACGRIVIMNEIVKKAFPNLKNRINCILIKYNDTEVLETTFSLLLGNSTLQNKISKNAKELILNNCDVEKHLKQIGWLEDK